jgi:hypothetical protein
MSDADLERKFLGLADDVLPQTQAKRVMDMCWKVETLDNAGDIPRAGAIS